MKKKKVKPKYKTVRKKTALNYLAKSSKKIKILLAFLIGGFVFCIYLFWGMPTPFNLNSSQISVSTKLFDRYGKLLYEIYTDERRTPIKLAGLPPYVVEATLAIEDK